MIPLSYHSGNSFRLPIVDIPCLVPRERKALMCACIHTTNNDDMKKISLLWICKVKMCTLVKKCKCDPFTCIACV